MNIDLELLTLCAIVHNPSFCVRATPYIKSNYFERPYNSVIFDTVIEYYTTYNSIPTKEAASIEIDQKQSIPEEVYKQAKEQLEKIYSDTAEKSIQKSDEEWLIKTVEKWCLDRSVYIAITQCIDILDDEDSEKDKSALPSIMEKALSVSFDSDIGHDYLKDYSERYDFYHSTESRVELPLKMLNRISRGGPTKKSLSLCIAPTGVGKSLWLSFLTTFLLKKGYNILYVTLELSEEMIGERMDSANLDCTLDNLSLYDKKTYEQAMKNIREKYTGNIIIKEYPPSTVNVNHLRFLMDELKMKKGFEADIVVVDYINLLSSATLKKRENMYTHLKAVAEELRGLGVERDVAIMSACQTNRTAQNAADYDLTEMGESHGLSATADFVFGLIETPEMREQNQYRVKMLKNRFGPLSPQSFVVGVDKSKMIMYDLDDSPVSYKEDKEKPASPPSTIRKDSEAVGTKKITDFKL